MHDIINDMTDDMSTLKTPFESFPLDSLMVNETNFLIYNDDALSCLERMPDGSVDCIVTSPPYYGLRDYGGVIRKSARKEHYKASLIISLSFSMNVSVS